MGEKIGAIIFTEKDIAQMAERLAQEIDRDYAGKPLHLICVLRGAVPFFCALSMRLKLPVTMDFVRVASYVGTESGQLKAVLGVEPETLVGKDVLIVEDIVDSGHTLNYLRQVFTGAGARSVKACVMLDKPSRRVVDIEPDYCGAQIEDVFVIGCGLDYEQRYRNLPYVAKLELTPD